MKRTILFVAGFVLAVSLVGQATFIVVSLPENTPEEDILYVAGTFNDWYPGDPDFALEQNADDLWEITLDAEEEGTEIEFKFTRGSWETVEKGPDGEEIANRKFTYGNGDTIPVTIYNWADIGPPEDSTAAWNVSIMDEDFYMPQLDRTRRIWLYLPPDYHDTDHNYPVLYMHDGQNLFEVLTSYAGEWEVDETLNALADSGYQVPIVIGIDNGGIYRTEELTPWINPQYSTGRGEDYMAFIVETLKPHVDSSYRTLKGRDHTGIMGSSLGGLISTFGALEYQDVFSKSGPFSPAYWINYDSMFMYVHETGKIDEIRFYQNAGELEGSQYIDMMEEMEDSLMAVGFDQVTSKVIDGGDHNEATWRDDFANAYLWLFDSFATDVRSYQEIEELKVVPNPAKETILFKDLQVDRPVNVKVYNLEGKVVVEEQITTNSLDVSKLPTGFYALQFTKDHRKYVARFVKQ